MTDQGNKVQRGEERCAKWPPPKSGLTGPSAAASLPDISTLPEPGWGGAGPGTPLRRELGTPFHASLRRPTGHFWVPLTLGSTLGRRQGRVGGCCLSREGLVSLLPLPPTIQPRLLEQEHEKHTGHLSAGRWELAQQGAEAQLSEEVG